MTKTIVWVGNERMLPGIGIATVGKEITGDSAKLDSYVKQGLAEYKQVKMVKPTVEETDK